MVPESQHKHKKLNMKGLQTCPSSPVWTQAKCLHAHLSYSKPHHEVYHGEIGHSIGQQRDKTASDHQRRKQRFPGYLLDT